MLKQDNSLIHLTNVTANGTMEWCKSQSQVLFTTLENKNVCSQINIKTNTILKNNDENTTNILDKIKTREIVDAEKCYVCLGNPINIDKLSTYSRKIAYSSFGLNQRYPKRKNELDNEERTISQYVGPFNLDFLTSSNDDKIHENDTCLDGHLKKKCKSQKSFSKLNVVSQQINPASIDPYLKPKPKCKTPVSELVDANVKKHLTECQRQSVQCDSEFCRNCNRKGGSSKRKQPKMTRIDKQTFSMLRYAINKRTMCRRIPVSVRKLLKNNINLIVYSNKRRRYRHKYNKYSIKYVNECWRICRESNSVTKSINRNFRKTKKSHTKSQHQKQSSSNLVKQNDDEENSFNLKKSDVINNSDIVKNNLYYPDTECVKSQNFVINDYPRITQNNNLSNSLVNDTSQVRKKGDNDNLANEQNKDETFKNLDYYHAKTSYEESTTSSLVVPIKTNIILGISIDDCNSKENNLRDIYNIPEKKKEIMTITLESDNESVLETSEDEEESDSFIIIDKSKGNGIQYNMSNENIIELKDGIGKETLKNKFIKNNNYSQCNQIPLFDPHKITESGKDIPTITLESDSDSMSETSEDEEQGENYIVLNNRKNTCKQRNMFREIETIKSKSKKDNYNNSIENDKDIMTIILESDCDSASEISEDEENGKDNVDTRNSNSEYNNLKTDDLENVINITDQDNYKNNSKENNNPQVNKNNQVINSTMTTYVINQTDVKMSNSNDMTTTNSLVKHSSQLLKPTNIADKDVIECTEGITNQENLRNNKFEEGKYFYTDFLDEYCLMNTEEEKPKNVEKCYSNVINSSKNLVSINSGQSFGQNNILDPNITNCTKDMNRDHNINDSGDSNGSFVYKNNPNESCSVITETMKHSDIEKCNSNDESSSEKMIDSQPFIQNSIIDKNLNKFIEDIIDRDHTNINNLDVNSLTIVDAINHSDVDKCNLVKESNIKNSISSKQLMNCTENLTDINNQKKVSNGSNCSHKVKNYQDTESSVITEALQHVGVEKCNLTDEFEFKHINNSCRSSSQYSILNSNAIVYTKDNTAQQNLINKAGDGNYSQGNEINSLTLPRVIEQNNIENCSINDDYTSTKNCIGSSQIFNHINIFDRNNTDNLKDVMDTDHMKINYIKKKNQNNLDENSSVITQVIKQIDIERFNSNDESKSKYLINSSSTLNKGNTTISNKLKRKNENKIQDNHKNNFDVGNYSQKNQNYGYENSIVTTNLIEHDVPKKINFINESNTKTLIGSNQISIFHPKMIECMDYITDQDNLNKNSRVNNCKQSLEIKNDLQEESSVMTGAIKYTDVEKCNSNDKSSFERLIDSCQSFNQFNILDTNNIEYTKDNTTQVNLTNNLEKDNYSHQNRNHPYKNSLVTSYEIKNSVVKCKSNDGCSTKNSFNSSQTFNQCNIFGPNEIVNEVDNLTQNNLSYPFKNSLLTLDAIENNYVEKLNSNNEFSSEKYIDSCQLFIQNSIFDKNIIKYSEDITNQDNSKNNLEEKSSLTTETIQPIIVEKYNSNDKSNFENLIDFSQSFSQNSSFDSHITGHKDDITGGDYIKNNTGNGNCADENKNNLNQISSVTTEAIVQIDVEKCNLNYETTTEISIGSRMSFNQNNILDVNFIKYKDDITNTNNLTCSVREGNFSYTNKNNLNLHSTMATQEVKQIDVIKSNSNDGQTTKILNITHKSSINTNCYEFPSHSNQSISFPHELHLHKVAMENMTNLTNCIDEYCKQLENNSVINSNLTFDSSLLTDVNVIPSVNDENIVTKNLSDLNISSINDTFGNNKSYISEPITIEKCNSQLNEKIINSTNDFEKIVLEENMKQKVYHNTKKVVEDKNNLIMNSSVSRFNANEKTVDLTFESKNGNSDNIMYYLDNTSNEDVCKMMLDIVKKTYTYSEFLMALDDSIILQSELNKYNLKLPIDYNNMKLNVMNFIEIYVKWFENDCTSREKCYDKYPVALLKSMISYIVEDSGTAGNISTAKKAIQTLINNFSKEKLFKQWHNRSNVSMSIDNNNASIKGIQEFQTKEYSNTVINSTGIVDSNNVRLSSISNDEPNTLNLFDDINNLNDLVPQVSHCNYVDNSFNHFEMSNLRSDESNLYEDISDVEEDPRLTYDNTLNNNLSNISDDLMINVNVDYSSLDFNDVCPFDKISTNNTYDSMIHPVDTSYTNNSDNPDMINKMLDLNLTSSHISKIEEERLLMSVCDQSVGNVNDNLCVDDLEISTTDDFFSGFDNAGTLCS